MAVPGRRVLGLLLGRERPSAAVRELLLRVLARVVPAHKTNASGNNQSQR
jgi:hypothetical protein